MRNKYMKELQKLKSWDVVESIVLAERGYDFITTCGHGYLVIPKNDKNYGLASKIVGYGYKGDHAIYLEEDCEYHEFMKQAV